jgi:hypothetical protein
MFDGRIQGGQQQDKPLRSTQCGWAGATGPGTVAEPGRGPEGCIRHVLEGQLQVSLSNHVAGSPIVSQYLYSQLITS